MRTLKLKCLAILGAAVMISGFTADDVLGQRPSRPGTTVSPGAGGTARPSRPTTGANRSPGANNRPPASANRPSRPDYRPNRPGLRPPSHRPNYRPGYTYHRPYYGYYNFYRPFLGIRINVLPYGYYPFYFGPDRFFYSGGFFYRQFDDGYKVVVPPVGAQVPSIPSEAKSIEINGQTYYEYKGVYYTSALAAVGIRVYVVAGKDGVLDTDKNAPVEDYRDLPKEGDIVDKLPENVRDVVIKGTLYYVSEDGIYFEKIVEGGRVAYKVVGVGN